MAVCYWRFAEGTSHGGDARAQAFVAALESLGHEVVKIPVGATTYGRPDDGGPTKPPLAQVVKRSLFPLPFRRAQTMRDLADSVSAAAPDIVISCVPVAHLTALESDTDVVWLDYFDSWAQMGRNEIPAAHRLARPVIRAQSTLWAGREFRESRAAAYVTYAGYGDLQRSARHNSLWLPTPVSQPPGASTLRERDDGFAAAGLIANWDYWPNRDAWEHFCSDWLPQLRAWGISTCVAGLGSDSLPIPEDVRLLGEVDQISEFYEAIDIALVPVRRGGGIKVKALEALTWGKTVWVHRHVMDGLPPGLRGAVQVFDSMLDPNARTVVPRLELEAFTQARFRDTVESVVGAA